MKGQKKILVSTILVFCLLALKAQERRNSPLPHLISPPYAQLSDSIIGWSRSTDGQWISAPRSIPPIGISRDDEFYDSKDARLGIDNIQALQAYRVNQGRDTLVALVKLFDDGQYKYPLRGRGWRVDRHAYYILVNIRYLKEAIASVKDPSVQVLRVKALDGGLLPKVSEKKISQRLGENLLIKDKYDRILVLTVQLFPERDIARFHFCSMHEVFPDVEGVRKNFKRRGRTVFGSESLFDFFYFELSYSAFMSLFELPPAADTWESEESY